MIINLCGCPASGKSTFAARFVLEHSQFLYAAIDEYRIKHEDEALAWTKMTDDILSHKNTVIESCGMGWRLGQILNLPTLRRRPLLTIAFTGQRSILLQRLRRRHKRPLPEPFRHEDELLALDFALEHFINEVESKVDYTLITTNQTREEVYDEVNDIIQTRLLFNNGQREFRRESFPESPQKGRQAWALGL